MSTRATATVSATAECSFDDCDDTVPEHGGVRGQYCSRDCRYRDVAAGLLETIRYDHRFCASCYRQIREVYPPGRRLNSRHVYADGPDDPAAEMNEIPEWAVGYAVPLPGTEPGLSESLRPRNPTEGDWETVPDDSEHLRMVCQCGATHHQTVDRPLPLDELMDTAKRLSGTLDALLSEEKHDWHHNRDTLLNEVREIKSDPETNGELSDQRILIDALAEAIMGAKPYQDHANRRDN